VFAACAPGLEPVSAAELAGLGLDARAVPGGVEAEGEDAAAWVCLGARTADACLVRLWTGDARELPAAKREARRRAPRGELRIRVDGPSATLSIEAPGGPLYRRGWRARVGAAPLRETLAAGVLLACGYGGDRPFLDPMCGSGTLAIEAALLAARRAPGLGRTGALSALPGADPGRIARIASHLRGRERRIEVPIHASDRNAGALRLARKNAEAAGLADAIRFEREDAGRAVPPPGPGLCAVNPPYGARLEDARPAWEALAALLGRLRGWDAGVLAPERPPLERALPFAPSSSLRLRNGGLACRLLQYHL
jgi:putative N6-adenine-specific DNA methylase